MIEVVKNYLDNIFNSLPQTEEVLNAKRDLFDAMEEKFFDLKSEGESDADAFATVIAEFGSIEEILEDLDLDAGIGEKENFESSKSEEEVEKVEIDVEEVETKKKRIDIEFDSDKREKSIFDEEVHDFSNYETKNTKSRKVFGIILLFIAVTIASSAIFGTSWPLFFNGWWTLFLIVPGLSGMIKKEEKTGSIILFSIGVILLFGTYFDNGWMWTTFIFFVLLVYGLRLLFPDHRKIKVNINSQGDDFVAVFGSSDVDFTKEDFTKDKHISCVAVFGNIDIKVPEDVNVVTSGVSVMGSTSSAIDNREAKHTLYIEHVCVFGGIEIK